MGSWFDYTVNGLIIGNIYALLAVGLALIFGVSHLINFAQGSIYTVGAYIGWTCITYLHTPLPVTMLIVLAGCGLLGVAIERIGLRPEDLVVNLVEVKRENWSFGSGEAQLA